MISECPVHLLITHSVETAKEGKITNDVKTKPTQNLVCLHYKTSYMLVKLCTSCKCPQTKNMSVIYMQ